MGQAAFGFGTQNIKALSFGYGSTRQYSRNNGVISIKRLHRFFIMLQNDIRVDFYGFLPSL